ncbi:winged helix-turn-helix transcriptional regulator [Martelella alba]|uniref:Winged helix-turn-helix transcriptional regulator n=1 Tax=Martelella alba TaxID=2590451 RepID=A0A506UFG6_9HYPH|nr:metalloregulator ArsR/SmtB family transcription factor [Martelella alba]TPW32296.1 winged helix-turn-helix transcriptional regulator [Martelella alba]
MKIKSEDMLDAANEACELLKALGNRHRLLILCQLIDGERSVGQLADFLGIRDSTVSQHLALLRRDKLISGRRDGQTIWYRIDSEPARDIVTALYKTFCATDFTCVNDDLSSATE